MKMFLLDTENLALNVSAGVSAKCNAESVFRVKPGLCSKFERTEETETSVYQPDEICVYSTGRMTVIQCWIDVSSVFLFDKRR